MSIDSTTDSILKALEKYQEFLTGMDEDQFQKCPAEDAWSYSEVYSHILYTNTGGLIAIERCMNDTKSSSGRMQLQARFILFFGIFPFGKIKAPEKIAAKVQKITTEEARNGLLKLRERISEIAYLVKKASPKQKIRHLRLGFLNARQWLRFIEIHSHHHLKQLRRIKAMLLNR